MAPAFVTATSIRSIIICTTPQTASRLPRAQTGPQKAALARTTAERILVTRIAEHVHLGACALVHVFVIEVSPAAPLSAACSLCVCVCVFVYEYMM